MEKNKLYTALKTELTTQLRAKLDSKGGVTDAEFETLAAFAEGGLEQAFAPIEANGWSLKLSQDQLRNIAKKVVESEGDDFYKMGYEAVSEAIAEADVFNETEVFSEGQTITKEQRFNMHRIVNQHFADTNIQQSHFQIETHDDMPPSVEPEKEAQHIHPLHAPEPEVEEAEIEEPEVEEPVIEVATLLPMSPEEASKVKLPKAEIEDAIIVKETIPPTEERTSENIPTGIPADILEQADKAIAEASKALAKTEPTKETEKVETPETAKTGKYAMTNIVSVKGGAAVLATTAGLAMLATSSKTEQQFDQETGQTQETKKPNWFKRVLGVAVIAVAAFAGNNIAQGKSWTGKIKAEQANQSTGQGIV